jgi:hypothetical protein
MTLTNMQTETLMLAIQADKALGKASLKFAERVAAMREAGWKADAMKEGNNWLPVLLELTAPVVCNAKELAILADTSLAVSIVDPQDKSKRIKTKRGTLANRVSAALGRVRDDLVKLESAALGGAAELGADDKTSTAKGTRGQNKPLGDSIVAVIDAQLKRIATDASKESPVLKAHDELRAAFIAARDMIAPPAKAKK